MILALYRGASVLAGPAIALYLNHRLARGKEPADRLGERSGIAGRPRPPGPLIWLHAASVGEATSALALIGRLLARQGDGHLLVTTGTVTAAQIMAERLPPGAFHQYVPVDRPVAVRRFLDHWRPDLAVWIESELWPNLVLETARRGTPMALVQGRMSARSYARWRRLPGTIGRLLGAFRICLAQSPADAERLTGLGANAPECPGNLKFAAAPLPVDRAALDQFAASTAGRPLWLAASTHAGEEAAIATAHRAVAVSHPELLTVIVPRHADRGAEIADALDRSGLVVARRSAGAPVAADTEIYLADTMGELGLFYRLAEVIFVGGSLAAIGGHNPLEPALLGAALVAGPHMFNFDQPVEALAAGGAIRRVRTSGDLASVVTELLGDEAARTEMKAAARQVAEADAGVLDRVLARLEPLLPEAAERARART